MGSVKVWDGGSWVNKTSGLKHWDGAQWTASGTIKYWNGTQWVPLVANAYPTVFGTPTTASTTNADPLSPGFPAGYTWQANDFGLFIAASNTATTPTFPAGWTAIDSFAFGSSYIYGAYRALQSGDSAPTFLTTGAGTKAVAGLTVFRNATLDGSPAFTRETVNQSAHPAPGITTTGTNRLVVYMFAEKSSTNAGWTDPAGTTRLLQQLTAGPGAVSALMTDVQVPTATAVGATTASVTSSSAQATGFTIALKTVV